MFAPFFGVNINYFSKYLRIFFQKIGPAGGWGRSRPFFGVNIDYFSKYLRKIFQKIGPAGGWAGLGGSGVDRPALPPPPRGPYFLKNVA